MGTSPYRSRQRLLRVPALPQGDQPRQAFGVLAQAVAGVSPRVLALGRGFGMKPAYMRELRIHREDDTQRNRERSKRRRSAPNTCAGCGDIVAYPGAEFCSDDGDYCRFSDAGEGPEEGP